LVFDSLLHPDDFCSDGDGAVDDRGNVFRAAEDVDDFDRVGFRDVFEARVGFFAEDLGFVGIYGDDAVAGGLHVLSDAETGTSGIGREADYRDGFVVFEDVGYYVIAAWPVFGDGCFHRDDRDWEAARLSRSSLGIGAEWLAGIFSVVRICGTTGIGRTMLT
jgi:hypothetical protein